MHFALAPAQLAILVLYVMGTVAVGLRFARGQKNVEGYYLAERSAPPWAIAISIISSDTTAISYLGCAALVFTSDLQFFLGAFTWPLAAIIVARIFVPHLAKDRVFTVYQYLEFRFNVQVRAMASALFMMMRGCHLAVALYGASIVISQLFGYPIWAWVAVLGGLTTVYTVLGGMKAVIWTDVIQFFVLTIGLIAVIVGIAGAFHWNLASIWHLAGHPRPIPVPWLNGAVDTTNHTRAFNFSPSLTNSTFWAVMITCTLQGVASFGSDQVLVQRYLSAGSSQQMVKSLIGGGLLQVPILFLMYASGIFLVAYYSNFLGVPGFAWVGDLHDSNRVMVHFISHGLPGTLAAIVLAGLFSGTMSSFSAGLNSLSTATYVDFIKRFASPTASQRQAVRTAKIVTCAWGLLVMAGAAFMGGSDTILVIFAKITSPFAGPLLGIFLLGMLSRRVSSFDVMVGAVVGGAMTVFVTYGTPINWMWYFVVGSMTCVLVGYLSSLRPRRSPA